jgi:hypothetical protein
MSTGSSDTRPFGKWFQVRWAERLGDPRNPYLVRYTFILFGRSIRFHHWLRSDDRRFFHDHSANLLSIVLKGYYRNVVPIDPDKKPSASNNRKIFVAGMFNSLHCLLNWKNSVWFSKATAKHFLDIPKEGAWTLLLEGKKYHKWGFYVPRANDPSGKVRKMRPLAYFHKYGIIQSDRRYQ